MNNIFVGNLSFQATKEDLIKLFEPFGLVSNAVIMERKKGKSRGYGFVDMPNEEEKNAAIVALQGKEFMWRELSVSMVIPKVKSVVQSDRKDKPVRKSHDRKDPISKSDGLSKPWRKSNIKAKSSFKKDTGSRPYYGKKEDQSKPFSKRDDGSKPFGKPRTGFKMKHKVSGVARVERKKEVL